MVYEGRYSGDDGSPAFDGEDNLVTAFHTGGFNSGNLGIALLGNLSERGPTDAAKASLIRLIEAVARLGGLDPAGGDHLRQPGERRHQGRGDGQRPPRLVRDRLPRPDDARPSRRGPRRGRSLRTGNTRTRAIRGAPDAAPSRHAIRMARRLGARSALFRIFARMSASAPLLCLALFACSAWCVDDGLCRR
ncbi:hypothetical protein ACFW5S_29960 [Streptomyces olivaceus]|uniref:hypothetical protein n=1 Tax=Streptomyces olivaceus TaxID=47716 RepID=UPI0033A896FD